MKHKDLFSQPTKNKPNPVDKTEHVLVRNLPKRHSIEVDDKNVLFLVMGTHSVVQNDGYESVKSGKVLLTGEVTVEFAKLKDDKGKTSEGLAVSVNQARIQFSFKVGVVFRSNVLDKIRIGILLFEHVVNFEKSFVGF